MAELSPEGNAYRGLTQIPQVLTWSNPLCGIPDSRCHAVDGAVLGEHVGELFAAPSFL